MNNGCKHCGFGQMYFGFIIQNVSTGAVTSSIFDTRQMAEDVKVSLEENVPGEYKIIELPVEQQQGDYYKCDICGAETYYEECCCETQQVLY